MQTKDCRACGETKPVSEFYTLKRRKRGKLYTYQYNCKPCDNRARKERWYMAQYGITVAEYEAKVAEQGNRCDICKGPPTGQYKKLHVDHCHETGKVRGLLCVGCNQVLGLMQDSPAILRRAAEYLEHSAG